MPMKHLFAAGAILIAAAALNAPAYADAVTTGTLVPAATQILVAKPKPTQRSVRAPQTSNKEVTYDRDSKDPNVGWHTQGGMRVCTQDCDNPEIPGSGYTCRDVNFLGMPMRECDWSSW
jgi:hypothetical protein